MQINKNTCQYLFLWLFSGTFFSPCLQAQQGVKKETQGILTDVKPPFNAVEVLDFMGFYSKTKHQVTLSWETGDEKDCKNFLIERRDALEDKWDILGFVTAKGKAGFYDFIDLAPLPLNYYRMRTIDKMGKPSLLKIISVSKDDVGKLKVHPQIVKDSLLNIVGIEILENTLENKELGVFIIFNVLNQQVMHGKTTVKIDVSYLPRGIYFLKIGQNSVKFFRT